MPANALRKTLQRVFRLENRRRAVRRGTLDRIPQLESKILGNAREVTVYLPPGYESGDARYPVLYMQDGQNLFDPLRAFIPGQHWRLAEAADDAIGERTAAPMIIVGIDNAGPARIEEYTPTHDADRKSGGRAAVYGRFLIEELKPLIDASYRTRVDAQSTAIAGSSLGGLLTLFLGLTHPDVFTRLGVMSPSVWWDCRAILDVVDDYDGPPLRTWLDIGGREGAEALDGARTLRDRLAAKHFDLRYLEDRRADHSERAWARRVRAVLEFLFPPA